MPTTYVWDEEICRRYADALRPMAKYDHRRWAQTIAAELADLPRGSTIVDIASGPAFLLVELGKLVPGARLIAQDQAAPMMPIAEAEAKAAGLAIRTVCCAAESLTLENAAADVITCKQLLHEVANPAQVIAEMARILAPGGRLFLIDFDADGSRLAAMAIRTLVFFMAGRETAGDFWRSFEAGLPGSRVLDLVRRAGFVDAQYQKSGPNYLVTGVKRAAD